MNDFFSDKSKRAVNKDGHAQSDVDDSRDALHHTLGGSPNQAAQGNHNHDTVYSKLVGPKDVTDLAIPAFANFTSASLLTRRGNVVTIYYSVTAIAAAGGNSATLAIQADHVIAGVGNRYFWAADGATGAARLVYVQGNSIYLVIGCAAGDITLGYISYVVNN